MSENILLTVPSKKNMLINSKRIVKKNGKKLIRNYLNL